MKETTDAKFEQDVLQASSNKPVLVDFWASWCGPCKAIAPILDSIDKEYSDKIDIVKINVDENPETSAQFGITSIPVLHVFQNGQIVKSVMGAMPKTKLVKELDPFISDYANRKF